MSGDSPANRQIARAAGTVMLAFVFSQVIGLARSILVAGRFGASAELDAFLAANRVSETLFLLVAGGALGSAFIPKFTEFLVKQEREKAWNLASAVGNSVLLVLSGLAMLTGVFAPQVVRYVLAPGFSADPAQLALTVHLLRIQLVASVLFGLGGLVVGILNSHQVFLIPALTPAMYQSGIIFGVLVLSPKMGIYGLAWGVVLGAGLYLGLQIPDLLKRGGFYRLTLGWGNPAVAEVVRLMGPRLLGVAVVQLNFWVNIWLASRMAAGSVTALSYGFALMLMAQAAIAQSIATAAMPTLAAQFALGQMGELRASLASSLRGVLLLSLPAAAGLILLREPIVALLYQRGQFDSRAVQMVAWALLWYALGLVGHAVLEVLARAFYALHDTLTPVLVGVAAMTLNVFFSFLFSTLFQNLGLLPHGGLALANSLATALEAAALFMLMRRRLQGIEGKRLAAGFGQALIATAVLSVGVLAWLARTNGQPAYFTALGGMALGGLLYFLTCILLRVPELTFLYLAICKRLRG
jgi:putative peptidoglycan lipid II flippase